MPTAREIMTPGAEFVDIDASVVQAAKRMADHDFGALPICDAGGKLEGMITDRDIVVKVIAAGLDPRMTTVRQLAETQSDVVTIGADDAAEEAIRTMKDH